MSWLAQARRACRAEAHSAPQRAQRVAFGGRPPRRWRRSAWSSRPASLAIVPCFHDVLAPRGGDSERVPSFVKLSTALFSVVVKVYRATGLDLSVHALSVHPQRCLVKRNRHDKCLCALRTV